MLFRSLIAGFKQPELIDSVMNNLSVINMLNTKYYIYDLNSPPLANSHAMGNAWFVKEVKMVDNADEEVVSLKNFDPKSTAIVNKRFENELGGWADSWDPMIAALDWLQRSHEGKLYQSIFFQQQIKFQYPPTSLLPLAAMRAAGVPLSPDLLNVVGWVWIEIGRASWRETV